MHTVTLQGKIIGWLLAPVYREMQARQQATIGDEQAEIYWNNDLCLYERVLNDMLAASHMTLRDLQYEYGDLSGDKSLLPNHPPVSDAVAIAAIRAFWRAPAEDRTRNARPAEIADRAQLNYEQVKRLLCEWIEGTWPLT